MRGNKLDVAETDIAFHNAKSPLDMKYMLDLVYFSLNERDSLQIIKVFNNRHKLKGWTPMIKLSENGCGGDGMSKTLGNPYVSEPEQVLQQE